VNPKTDWRADTVTSLASDWTSPWTGTTHLAGARVAKVTPGRDAVGRPFSFVSPSPEALAISVAHKAAVEAGLALRDVVARPPRRAGEAWEVDGDDLVRLFDYFEASFVVVQRSPSNRSKSSRIGCLTTE